MMTEDTRQLDHSAARYSLTTTTTGTGVVHVQCTRVSRRSASRDLQNKGITRSQPAVVYEACFL